MSALLLLVFLLASQASIPRGINFSAQREQSNFSTESEVVHNISLPSAIRESLLQDPFVRETLREESQPLTSLPEDWTLCSVAHLATKTERDYVVVGQRFLTGAHGTHFWVFRETPDGIKLVLAAFADSLRIGQRRTNGFRDITTLYYTAVNDGEIRNVFDGSKYQSVRVPQFR